VESLPRDGESGLIQGEVISPDNFPMTKFWAIFSTQSISLLGSQIVQFSLVWWLTKISGSASVLAVASIMALLPQVFISPIAGAYVDRWNRRLIMIAADGLIAFMVIILALLYAFDLVQIWHIYALMFLRAVGGAFHFPAMQASTTFMVKKDNLARVAGLTQALNGLVSILAPAIGALLYELWPLQSVLMIDVTTASIAIMILLLTKIPQPKKASESAKSLISDIRDGVNYLLHWRGGLYLSLGAVLINLFFVPAISLTAILVQRFFAGEALQYATLESALGIGMVVGGVSLGVWGGFKSKVKTAMIALIIAGLCSLTVGILPSSAFLLAVACFFIIGAMLPMLNGSLFALLQAMIPPDLQGRVFTIVMATSAAMAPLGLAVAGPVSDLFGVQIWFIFGGLVMAGFGTLSYFVPSMRDMEKMHDFVKKDSSGDPTNAN
jgi:MFS transporter, DHA3 family, macrolide efflux protein